MTAFKFIFGVIKLIIILNFFIVRINFNNLLLEIYSNLLENTLRRCKKSNKLKNFN